MQQEMFPDKKIFSDAIIAYWLSILTIFFLIFSVFSVISFIIPTSRTDDARTAETLAQLESRMVALEGKIENLKTSSETTAEITPKETVTDTTTTEDTSTKIDTTDWQDYSSANYNFSVKIPKDWKIDKKVLDVKSDILEDKNASMVSFTSPSNSVLSIDPEGKFKIELSGAPEVSTTTVDSKNADKNIYDNGSIVVSFASPKNFKVEYEQFNKKDRDLFETILKTLKFQ